MSSGLLDESAHGRSRALLWPFLTDELVSDATYPKSRSQRQKLVLCWVSAGIETGVEDSGDSPMVEARVMEARRRGGEERIDIVVDN